MYRSIATRMWEFDDFLSMSPEQRYLYIFLSTNPASTTCGIYELQFKTMAFQSGLVSAPFESALRGLSLAHPSMVIVDWETNEVCLPMQPRTTLVDASPRVWKHVTKEIEKVKSKPLLRAMIEANSSTIGAYYRAHLNRLTIAEVNASKGGIVGSNVIEVLDDNMLQVPEDQGNAPKYKIKENKINLLENKEVAQTEETGKVYPAQQVMNNLLAFEDAAKFMQAELEKRGMAKGINPASYSQYFQNKQKKGDWSALILPKSEGEKNRWIGQHYAGIVSWRPDLYQPKGGVNGAAPERSSLSL